MPESPSLYAIIDLETTGGDPKRDRITEVAIYVYDGEKEVGTYSTLVNPEVLIPSHITRITGIDNEMVKDAPRFFEIAKDIVTLTEGAVFVAHNVRFDYGFMHNAFRRLGYSYTRKQLCTIKLAKKVMPGQPSYSLTNLCKALKVSNRAPHRAWGDAEATLEVFKRLTGIESNEDVPLTLQAEIASSKLPPNLDPEKVDNLPGEDGVYYFFDKNGNILYIGKSTQIRKRVLSHFSSAHKRARTLRMIESIYDISYTLTGSELVALLLENEEIKQQQPPYNRAQRRTTLKFGIYQETNKEGYQVLAAKPIEKGGTPLTTYATRSSAEGILKRKAETFSLCFGLCGLQSCKGASCFYQQLQMCKGAGVGNEDMEVYNERVEAAVEHLIYGEADFLVIGKGREEDERSVVWVKNGIYQGFGYFNPEYSGQNIEEIIAAVKFRPETPDVRQIIQGYIRKHPKEVRAVDGI
ncbi:exonuclease domain-containing protein [bacterium]|nr:exonuclease domain-containing protein [bacterium]